MALQFEQGELRGHGREGERKLLNQRVDMHAVLVFGKRLPDGLLGLREIGHRLGLGKEIELRIGNGGPLHGIDDVLG